MYACDESIPPFDWIGLDSFCVIRFVIRFVYDARSDRDESTAVLVSSGVPKLTDAVVGREKKSGCWKNRWLLGRRSRTRFPILSQIHNNSFPTTSTPPSHFSTTTGLAGFPIHCLDQSKICRVDRGGVEECPRGGPPANGRDGTRARGEAVPQAVPRPLRAGARSVHRGGRPRERQASEGDDHLRQVAHPGARRIVLDLAGARGHPGQDAREAGPRPENERGRAGGSAVSWRSP